MKKEVDLFRNPGEFEKFCVKNDKVFGCRDAFKCHICCPLALAREVQYLVNEKGMTIGEAHRACLRKELTDNERYGILGESIRAQLKGKEEYPKENK